MDPVEKRFLEKVERKGGCWIWTGGTNSKGYGCFGNGSKVVLAHRFAYEFFLDRIPRERVVCHKRECSQKKLCVKPKHLVALTAKDAAAMHQAEGRTAWGERNAHAILKRSDVKKIRELFSMGGYRYAQLATMFKVGRHVITEIICGKTWAHDYKPYEAKLIAARRKLYQKLSPEQVKEIRAIYAVRGCTQVGLAKRFGVNHNTIWLIVHGKIWKEVK